MARIKITGYVEADDSELDPDHTSGITEEKYLELAEEFLGLDDFEAVAE